MPDKCIESLFGGRLRLPQLADYVPPSFEIDAIDPARVVANYPPRHPERDPTILFTATKTRLTFLPGDPVLTVGEERTAVAGRVNVRLYGPPFSRSVTWIFDGIYYSANASTSSHLTDLDQRLLTLAAQLTSP